MTFWACWLLLYAGWQWSHNHHESAWVLTASAGVFALLAIAQAITKRPVQHVHRHTEEARRGE